MTETKQIPLKLLLNNTGQIEGLPRNPRQIRDEQYKRLLASLQESDLTDFKPLLVYPHKDKYIVLGGNMRLRALRELSADDVSCIVVPADTPLEQLKKVVILDNSQFGEYDWDIIANEWSDEPLQDWGMELPIKKGETEDDGEFPQVPFTEVLGEEHDYIVLYFNNEVDFLQAQTLFEIGRVKEYSTRTDGKETKAMQRFGVGRVLNGADALNKILKRYD